MRGASLPAARLLTFDLRFWRDEFERSLRFLQHNAAQADQRGILGSFDYAIENTLARHCQGL